MNDRIPDIVPNSYHGRGTKLNKSVDRMLTHFYRGQSMRALTTSGALRVFPSEGEYLVCPHRVARF